jgi:hypothetical protein
MTLAQYINIQDPKKVNDHFLWKILKLGTALLKRLQWHTKTYTTVFGIMLLTAASIIFVYIHWSAKKLTQVFQDETVVEQK